MVRPANALLTILLALYATSLVYAQEAGLNSGEPSELPAPNPVAITVPKAATNVVEVEVSTDPVVSAEATTPAANTDLLMRPDEPEDAELDVIEIHGEPIERGPIHEAFAEPLELTPQPTEVLKKAPPATIKELAPERKPDETNVEWIAGYWAWDAQRSDYVWVSGVWRKKPVGREWVPGRWEEKPDGYQWVPGAWLTSNANGEVVRQVQEAPPETLEQGPSSPAPSEEHFWIPGVWKYNEQREYVWRPGFWSQSHSNWVWVPDHYTWTPSGCVYVAGYWDYPWERRGTLYAPCTFGTTVSTRFHYRPTRVIDTNQWLLSLWVGPRYGHYYFGDYYDYVSLGYSPWYSYYGRNLRHYDPFYSYYQWRFPVTYGFGLYGYLDGLYRHNYRHRASRPRVSHHRYDDWARGSRAHSSLYGDVNSLYGVLGRGDYRDRQRRDEYGRGPYYQRYGVGYGDRGSRSPDGKGKRRELIGYANGKALYSDEIGTGSRAEMGIGRRSRSGQGSGDRDGRRDADRTSEGRLSQGRLNDEPLNEGRTQSGRGYRDQREGRVERRSVAQQQERLRTDLLQADRQQRDEQARRAERNSAERSSDIERRNLAQQQNRLQADRLRRDEAAQRLQRAQQVQRQLDSQRYPGRRPNVERRNQSSRPDPSPAITRGRQSVAEAMPRTTPAARPNPVPRSAPAPRSSSPQRTTTRATPSRPSQVSRPSAPRSTPGVSRSASRPSAGFSTSSMKRSRGADRARQAAAMSQRMNQKGGRGK